MKGQKESVIEEVETQLPGFTRYKDNAILLLSGVQLETIKSIIYSGIVNSLIEYSKDRTNTAEVRSYARSMVMNHIKKAKELNGGHVYQSSAGGGCNNTNSVGVSNTIYPTSRPVMRFKVKIAPKGVNSDLLPDDLKEYVKTLV